MDRARAAQAQSAAELRACQLQPVAKHPEQWHRGIAIERATHSVYREVITGGASTSLFKMPKLDRDHYR